MKGSGLGWPPGSKNYVTLCIYKTDKVQDLKGSGHNTLQELQSVVSKMRDITNLKLTLSLAPGTADQIELWISGLVFLLEGYFDEFIFIA